MCAISSADAEFFGAVGSAVPQDPVLCIPVHPPLDVQKAGIVWHPGVFGRGTLLSCGCFTGYNLKGRDTRSISLCHDANVILIP